MHSHNLVEMRPPKPPRTDPLAEEIDPFHVGVSTSTPLALPEPTFAKFAEAQKLVQDYKAVAKPILPGDSVTILPLGTSSALPSKYRNGSQRYLHFILNLSHMNCSFWKFDSGSEMGKYLA